jgi:DNA-binding response OmpR family regulator
MKGKICIVDHDLADRGFLRECLEGDGHEVATLNSGIEIKNYIAENLFKIFIINLDTPGVQKKDLLLQIRKNKHTRVLLVVSRREDSFLQEAITMGVYGFIHKPFNPEEVCTMVNHLTR